MTNRATEGRMKEETKYRKEDRHTFSVADEFHNKFHYVVQEGTLQTRFLPFFSRVLHYAKKSF